VQGVRRKGLRVGEPLKGLVPDGILSTRKRDLKPLGETIGYGGLGTGNQRTVIFSFKMR